MSYRINPDRIKPGEARVDYAKTSAAKNRARARECVDGDEHTPDELRELHARLRAEMYMRNPERAR